MTFRARAGLTFVVAALLPVLLLGIGVRREMLERFDDQGSRRVAALIGILTADLDRDIAATRARLRSLAGALEDDNRFRLAETGGDRRWLVDWASGVLSTTGLAALELHDEAGRILSSGQFRTDFDRVAPLLPAALDSAPGGVALARLRTPGGGILALVTIDSLAVAGRRYRLVGGSAVDSARLAALAPGDEIAVTIALGDAGSAAPAAAAEIPLPLADDVAGTTGRARLIVTRDPRPAAAFAARVDRWIVGAVALTLVVAAALALWLAGLVSRPVAELAEKTERLDLERLDQDFATDRRDELGALSRLLEQMTRRLRAGAQRLREAERRATVGDLARQVNHDIGNGLAPIRHVIRHLTETAEREPDRLTEIYRERRGTLEASVEYLDGLARQYARLSPSGGPASGDVSVVLRDVAAGFRSERVTIETRIAERTPRVAADPVVLRRVVENLVANAVEAGNGTRTAIELAAEPVRTGGEARVRITVADDGRGMTAAELERAFDDFFTTKPEGTGLGLSVVRRLAGDFGGSVRIETEPGKGTRVFVELPAA